MNNRGDFYERTKTNPREKAFADTWESANEIEPNRCINFGNGLLQDLFMDPHETFGHKLPITRRVVTDGERFVAATVIQWLGSNCGMSFLDRALSKCGYRIVKDKTKKQNELINSKHSGH